MGRVEIQVSEIVKTFRMVDGLYTLTTTAKYPEFRRQRCLIAGWVADTSMELESSYCTAVVRGRKYCVQ